MTLYLALAVAVARQAAARLGADPSCETGIIAENNCCAKQCGRCGGPGCGALPGGADECCGGSIASSGRHCDESDPPCILTPSPSPAPPASRSATLTLDAASPIARVAPEFASFTLDSSAVYGTDLSGKNDGSGAYGATLDVLTRALLPAHLRVGGTQGDFNVFAGFNGNQSFPIGASCAALPAPMTPYRCREVTPTDALSLLRYVQRNNLTLVWGLNDMFGRPTKAKEEKPLCSSSACPPRNTTNYEAMLRWLLRDEERAALAANIAAFELGNELNSCLNGDAGAAAQGADFRALRATLNAVWGAAKMSAPRLAGPDTHSAAEFQTAGVAWFAKFVESAGAAVDHHTFHMYSLGNGPNIDPNKLDESYLSATQLDKSGEGVRALQKALPAARSGTLWGGETAAANCGGQSGVTDTFIDGFWYLDQLGQFAQLNVSVFLRQVFVAGGGYPLVEVNKSDASAPLLPLPDYYVALLHKRLMGTRVLKMSSSASNVRAYAHCARSPSKGVAIAYLNIALNVTASVTPPLQLQNASAQREMFRLSAGTPIAGAQNLLQSREVKLNGVVLALVPGSSASSAAALPPIVGQHESAAGTFDLPPSTYGFVHFPDARIPACAE